MSLIHRYQNNGYNIVLDINSGCLHVVDEVTYEVLPYMEEECDRMEYEGSLMFDEYPDRLMIEMVVDRIQKKVTGEDGGLEAEQFHGGMQPPPGHRPPLPPPPPGQNDHLRELIGVILNNEMYRRRCRHRRCRRWW